MKPFRAEIKVDGVGWYKGKASCILLGNVGDLFGGVEVFEDARPDDGMLELGVVTAEGLAPVGSHDHADGPRNGNQVAVRADHEGAIGEGQAESEGALRARRRRAHQGEVVQGQSRGGRDHGLCSCRRRKGRTMNLFDKPEPINVPFATVPDGPPHQFTWHRAQHAVVRVEGPRAHRHGMVAAGWRSN